MSGEPVLLRQGRIEGNRRNNGVRAKITGETSFHTGNAKIPAEIALCKRVHAVLNAEYPGHAWSVLVMMDQGVCQVSIPPLLGVNWGYILHIETMDRAAIRKAGGEILERFRIPRSTIDLAFYADAKARVPMIGNFRAGSRRLIPA